MKLINALRDRKKHFRNQGKNYINISLQSQNNFKKSFFFRTPVFSTETGSTTIWLTNLHTVLFLLSCGSTHHIIFKMRRDIFLRFPNLTWFSSGIRIFCNNSGRESLWIQIRIAQEIIISLRKLNKTFKVISNVWNCMKNYIKSKFLSISFYSIPVEKILYENN